MHAGSEMQKHTARLPHRRAACQACCLAFQGFTDQKLAEKIVWRDDPHARSAPGQDLQEAFFLQAHHGFEHWCRADAQFPGHCAAV